MCSAGEPGLRGVILRRACAADATPLTDVIRRAYAPYRDAGLALPPVEDGVAADIEAREVWVAEAGGAVVAGLVAERAQVTVHILNLAADPVSGVRGAGRMLLSHCLTRAARAGCRHAVLTTHRDMTRTRAFYRGQGWRETGQDGQKVYMSLELQQHMAKGIP